MLDARPVEGSSRRVVVYERVSSERQDLTRQAVQRDRARADYPGAEIVVVQDDGVSAFKISIFDRPGGRRLCDLIETGQVAALYTDAQDRLSRGPQFEWWNFADLCEQHGTRIVIDGRELRLDDEGDEIRSSLDQILARRESQQKAHRVSSARKRDASRGLRNPGPCPYGYQQSGRKLTLDLKEAEVLRRIRSSVVAGSSLSQIARDLNRDGITTANGAAWSQTRVSQMLANRLYVGFVRHYDNEYPGIHEPVFTQTEWDEAQAVLAARRARPGKGAVALAHAERQRALADDRYARVRRDYQDGRLDADDWREQRDELRDEQAAATEEVVRLEARVEKVVGHVALFDAEEDLLERLAELRAAVAGRVADGTTVEAMRTALLRLFSGFTLHAHDYLTGHTMDEAPLPEGWLRSRTYWHPGLTPPGTHLLEPHPRREMILDADKQMPFPELRRVPLEARVRIAASGR